MFKKPVQFNEFLNHHGLTDEIYKAMDNPDLAEPVIAVLDILRKTKHMPPLVKESKSETKSTAYRNEGNQAYACKRYQKALICYNKALLFAPKYSRAMKLAYSNRSALLHKIKEFSACLTDIETCFSMGCPTDIMEKLKKRKDDATNCLWIEKLGDGAKFSVFSEEYFQFNVNRNPEIPCASCDVGVIVENEATKVVAMNDIKVGAVLAVETAFVSQNDPGNAMFSCYHCHKMSLNLKPCDGCCFALFCDEICRKVCLETYHTAECPIIEVLESVTFGTKSWLALKAVLKMKHMSKSWNELIQASFTMGNNKLKTSAINEIYDSSYKFSLLNIKDERHFYQGPLYNSSFTCAAIIHHLESIHGFFPRTLEDNALRAVARLLMFLSLYSHHTQLAPCVTVNEQEKTEFHSVVNYGWYSFIGKLKDSCNPNILAVGLNKKLGLLAIAPIKKGMELTISHVGYWLDNPTDKYLRNRNMFMLYGRVCDCILCNLAHKLPYSEKLSDMQRKNYKKLNIEEIRQRFHPRNIPEVYAKLCKTLAFLSDLPYSDEYEQVYKLFRQCVLYLQDLNTENVILDYV